MSRLIAPSANAGKRNEHRPESLNNAPRIARTRYPDILQNTNVGCVIVVDPLIMLKFSALTKPWSTFVRQI
jgi:hypothetical protein